MLIEDELLSRCAPRTLQRAHQIAANERNFSRRACTCDHYGEVVLEAAVASSNGWHDRYATSVNLDADEEHVLDYDCTCPAYLNYDGMCKHCAALLLDFTRNPDAYEGYTPRHRAQTTPLLQEMMKRTRNLAEREERPCEIDLIPELILNYGTWSVRLSIASAEATYVVKDVSELLAAVRQRAYVSYGKKLGFVHGREAFTPAALRLLDVLESIFARAASPSTRLYAPPSRRSLDLAEADVIELLDAVEGGSILIQDETTGHRRSTYASIERGRPPLEARIIVEDDGYLVVPDSQADFLVAPTRAYVFYDGTFYGADEAFARAASIARPFFEASRERFYVAREDMPLFCATVLPVLEAAVTVAVPHEVAAMRPMPARIEYYFDREKETILLSVQAVYGAARFILGEAKEPKRHDELPEESRSQASLTPVRDERLEERALETAWRYVSPAFTLSLDDEEAAIRLLFGGLAQLRQVGEVFTTPAFDRLLTDSKPRWSYGISLSGDLIDLDISSEDLEPAELAEVIGSYRAKKRFHRLRSGAFLDLQQAELMRLNTLLDDLGLSASDVANGHLELPTYRAFYLDCEFAEAHRDKSFTAYLESFRAIDQRDYEPPEHLQKTLRPYQEEGFRWLSALCDMDFGGVLADEMGLGKSLQLIALLESRREQAREVGPSLIVCPASLVYNWLAEFERYAPQVRVRVIAGSRRERNAVRADDACEVFITSYDIARLDAEEIARRRYFCHVLDEAQYIKNHATLTTRAIKRIPSVHRFALTGTPMENRLSEIWSIFDFLMPGFLGSYARFRERFELGIVGGDEDLARRLRSLVGPFILRRLKSDVLPELPEKMESVVRVRLEGEQRKLYAAHEQSLRERLCVQKKITGSRANRNGTLTQREKELSRVEVLAELTRLRQIALDPTLVFEDYAGSAAKLDAIIELIEQARVGGEKMLVFSQFTSFLNRLEEVLDERGILYYEITGATPKAKRVQLVDAFNADKVPVFLISLKAGGTGLNLTGASIVIHADPWWNAAAQNQATDRAHRIGQERPVNVYRVIAADTIEERILALQDAKSDLAEAIVSSTSASSLAALSSEELYELLLG